MNTPSSKYLNLARRRGNGLNPGVSEALPRETLAEGVAAKHAGNEEAEGGKDRPDCIPEYCLFAKIFEGVFRNGSHTSILTKL